MTSRELREAAEARDFRRRAEAVGFDLDAALKDMPSLQDTDPDLAAWLEKELYQSTREETAMVKDSRTKVLLDDTDITAHIDGPVTVLTTAKDRALFYLDRRLRALEEQVVGHEGMAEIGLSYEARRRHVEAVEKRNEDNRHERDALTWLRDQAVEKL